jgi:hypothetical protein
MFIGSIKKLNYLFISSLILSIIYTLKTKGRGNMLPNTKIIIEKNGNSRIESLEKSDQCYKLSEMGKAAGKIISDEDKEHTPVYHTVHQKN